MKIEETYGFLFKRINNYLKACANNDLRPDDLTLIQVDALLMLSSAEKKIMTMKELEAGLHLAQSTVNGIVSRLEKKNLVVAEGDLSDKRIKVVRISELGEEKCNAVKARILETERTLISGLSEKEREQLWELLQKVCRSCT